MDYKTDLTVFETRYKNDEVGRPAWNPAVMLKIVLLGYARGLPTSRRIAKACEENVTFMALVGANSRPHFTVIADFITTMEKEVLEVFQNVLLVCSEMGLIGGEMFGIDGCKLSSNASKEWSGTKEELGKKKEKIEAVIREIVKKHREGDEVEAKEWKAKAGVRDERGAERVKELRRLAERIDKFLAENEDKIGKRGKALKSNITDNESAKMETSHGMVQGYNGVALVDSKHQVIVEAKAFGSGPEQDLLKPMVEGAKKNLEAIGRGGEMEGAKLVGDTGYHTEDNCKLMEEEKIDAYIPDGQYRRRDPRFADAKSHKPAAKTERFQIKDFKYDEKNNKYICPAGKELRLERRAGRIKNLEGRHYKAKQSDCSVCPLKRQCLRSDRVRQRYLFIIERRYDKNYSEAMIRKIDTPAGRYIYSRRMGIVEPVFGNIRSAKRLDHFTLRGKVKVTIQWMLYAIVHNIGKIFRYGQARLLAARGKGRKTHAKMTHSKLSYEYG